MRASRIDHERVAQRVRELEALSREAFAERLVRAAQEPWTSVRELATHEVAQEQQVELLTAEFGGGEEGA